MRVGIYNLNAFISFKLPSYLQQHLALLSFEKAELTLGRTDLRIISAR